MKRPTSSTGPTPSPPSKHHPRALPVDTPQLDALYAGLDDYVDYFVFGTYDSPYLMGDPQSVHPDVHFDLNFITGEGVVTMPPIPWVLAVPKATAEHEPPFPVAYWRHGTSLYDLEMVLHAGIYARQGVALASMDASGHGLALRRARGRPRGLPDTQCLGPAATAMQAQTPVLGVGLVRVSKKHAAHRMVAAACRNRGILTS